MATINTLDMTRQLFQNGAKISYVVEYLHGLGISKFESIKAIYTVFGVSLAEAKREVNDCACWSENKDDSSVVHEMLIEATQILANEQNPQ